MSPSSTRPRQSGFSLLEVLVAFVILAVSLGVIMRLFSTSLRHIARAETSAHTLAVAESALASLGVETPLSEGESRGDDGQGYRWSARVSHHDVAEPVLESPYAPILYQVDVTVTRDDSGEIKPLLTLTTLRLATKP